MLKIPKVYHSFIFHSTCLSLAAQQTNMLYDRFGVLGG
jgi:hypothetical protein